MLAGNNTIGKRLRSLREKRKVGQEDVALRAGLRGQTISRIERGIIKDPGAETLLKIATALDVRVSDLTGETDDTPPTRSEFNELIAEVRRLASGIKAAGIVSQKTPQPRQQRP